MPGVQLCFIDSSLAFKSREEKALQRTKALSHAARISHRRKPTNIRAYTRPAQQLPTKDQGSRKSNFAQHRRSQDSSQSWNDLIRPFGVDSEDDDWISSSPPISDPGSDAWSLHEDLDPFLRLPGPTSRKERDLLHHCKPFLCVGLHLRC